MEQGVQQVVAIRVDGVGERFDCVERMIGELHEKIDAIAETRKVPEYLSRKEVAELFKVSEVTVNEWKNDSIIQAYEIGNTVRYIKDEVLNAAKAKIISTKK